ncbi:helix-turn-helix domain-containing protein [Kineosporia succinea]|uniref:Transcriptional regulator with XRE-family HTH domain n=1 Tax=Kineosporia succinea TaxID=84632 RepID=A0ABT9P1G0_9ACTN|nr:helix-turn-helix transcriptional regulator [Kineosporia succinea]MDP9826526.1 transcriptional regulator with XRE-family HTH domain [Kineosporia succinea]
MDEFAQVLRAWRDRVTPEQVGLPAGLNRRASGLRREELALLAGVSVDYVVRLEQGRARHPSAQLLSALARALRLDDHERDHLFRAAGAPLPSRGRVPRHLSPGVQRIVDRLGDVPVGVHTAAYELVHWNPAWAGLFGDPSARSGFARNMIWRYYAGAPDRTVTHSPELEEAFARDLVGHLRTVAGRYPDDPEVTDLIEELTRASEEFRRRWAEASVTELRVSRKTVHHPQVGDLELDCDVLTGGPGDLIIVVMTAAPGSEAAGKLALLRVIGLQTIQA